MMIDGGISRPSVPAPASVPFRPDTETAQRLPLDDSLMTPPVHPPTAELEVFPAPARITGINCELPLTLHQTPYQQTGKLICHHCGRYERPPETCPKCGAEHSLVPCGPGIERLAEVYLAKARENGGDGVPLAGRLNLVLPAMKG